ncbi:DUF4238 domain-containing protein [Vibrio sinaloensis]|uniref:DUF4238 domain-containing protein n=1 Tax=Photobacterium sp. (strain ATCC 43367) TaxID=379097 RepID=UPI0022B033F8|nr:DUF4238 domain-containing protein [Vibrio sinaloensis]MCZ4293237.1 DUF4238 domain-containing protein [Vibrio sinaloensis]
MKFSAFDRLAVAYLMFGVNVRGKILDSVKHHYVPQLYLRGFTADNGRLQVFDKKYKRFKKDKETPKTVLFEKHRNTIEVKGVRTDKVEKLYSSIETPLGQFFDHVRKGISQDELFSENGIYLLKIFVATQFWRMPLLDDFADSYIQKLDLSRFGDRITVNGEPLGEVKEIIQLIENNKGFRHYFRSFYLPLLTFDLRVHKEDFHCWRLHTVSPKFSGWDNFLTGDNPLLVEDIAEMFAFKSKFILPLSKTQLVTYSPTAKNHDDFPPIFSTKLAMAMNSQSKSYLVGANREYMERMIELQESMYGADGLLKLRDELFEYL